ncbi:hypothetical protein BCV70DRAFT_209899 [Testicularia cyperi]|uniref:Uncharacterized protein n=1 Tax=Testicularia cyperi TaxID=1882483 RepID=A0A317XZE6_9BASI|nr:hypothetical protein BCV70DRAFT_209899 [Testicularia cyperi]
MSAAAAVSAPATDCPMMPSNNLRPKLSINSAIIQRPPIPTIVITPPSDAPLFSMATPEQLYDKAVLFVPVKTEELGWDEHGLYWNGTYAYPIHNIYDKEGQPIGRRRKGPLGYRFEEYYEGKKPRRRFGAPRTPEEIEAMESEILDPFMEAETGDVEEASVCLHEPAPARGSTSDSSEPQPPTQTRSTELIEPEPIQLDVDVDVREATPESPDSIGNKTAAEIRSAEEELRDPGSPISPTLSIVSDATETETASSICDDSSSLWSRSDLSDSEESACTSPGTTSPTSAADGKNGMPEPECLSSRLAQVASSTFSPNSRTSLSLGKLPSSSTSSPASSSRSRSLPTPRVVSKKPHDFSRSHRATSTFIVPLQPAPSSFSDALCSSPVSASSTLLGASSSEYSSIIQDLTSSPFASCPSPRKSSPTSYSSTFPRSSRKSSSSLLRAPNFSTSAARRHGSSRRQLDNEFASGWQFENQSRRLSDSWERTFVED